MSLIGDFFSPLNMLYQCTVLWDYECVISWESVIYPHRARLELMLLPQELFMVTKNVFVYCFM